MVTRIELEDAVKLQEKYQVKSVSEVLFRYDFIRDNLKAVWLNMPSDWYHNEALRRTETYLKAHLNNK